MKYLVLIYSNPEPWGHPTIDFTEVGRGIPEDERAAMHKEFEEMLAEISASGEFVTAEALGSPAESTIYRVGAKGRRVTTDGPYAEAKEQLAGFFLLDVASRERAEDLASRFAGPGDTVELRPVM